MKLSNMAQSITAGIIGSNDHLTNISGGFTVIPSWSSSSSTTPGNNYMFDINNDGDPDFNIYSYYTQMGMGYTSGNIYISSVGSSFTKEIAGAVRSCTWQNGSSGPTYTVTKTMATGFYNNDLINNSTTWTASNSVNIDCFESVGVFPSYGWSFSSFSVTPGYIGLRILCQNDTVYGWLKIKGFDTSNGPERIELEAYASNNKKCDVGVEQLNLSKNILIYPNPTQNTLNITLFGDFYSVIISISDLTGKTVISDRTIINNEPLNTSYLSPGIYTLKIQTENFTVHKKLVKE